MKNKLTTMILSAALALPLAFQAAPVQAAESARETNTTKMFTSIGESVTASKEYIDKVSEEIEDANRSNAIYQAAMDQIGVSQDCTRLVTNSLAAVGISFHGNPYSYSSLGEWTDTPVPGDIIIYSGHVAIYAGDGMAVHGGWLGYTTKLSTVTCTNPLIGYIHVA